MDMGMDMDTDIPQPDELEWLEANSHLQEEDYFDEPEPYPEENEGEPPQPQQQQVVSKPLLVIPAKLTIPPNPKLPPLADSNSISKTQINGQKRPQSDRPDALPDQLDGKRRRNDKVGSENDEDWLRFSPTRETEQTHVEEKRRRNGNVGTENDEEWLQYSTIIETEQTHVEEKRRRNGNVGTENDEVWLRYSPTRETEQTHREDPAIVPEEKIVARFASEIDGDCIPVTGFNGDRVYAKINRVETKDRFKKLDVQAHSSGGLILEPINILLQRVEQDAFTKALRASSEDHNDEILPQTSAVNEQLWVDKYAPNSFTELLSDEQTNREVLLWLKQWDSCVFGSEIRSTTEDVLASLRRHSSLHQKPSNRSFIRKNEGPRFGKENFTYSTNLIQDSTTSKGIQELWNKKSRLIGPPEQKILLLCGSPGLGKTTLAHVAAKHCGYRVVEINASDDRSSSTIESKIQDAVQMNSVIADSKPKCLVIDEIDGALGDGKGAVEVILKMVSADKKSDIGGENVADKQSGSLSSKKRGRAASLSRPVICICNDLYTPALRQLRQIAKIHIFVQPTVSRVVSRLKYICNKEGLRTSSIALTSLAEYTGCDIRSCLNTLQFLNKKKAALNPLEISSQVVGRKDMSRSVFDIWKEIFQKRKMRREKNLDNSCSRTSNEFNSLHSLVTSRGDNDLILDGIHENILHLRYHDPVMHKTVKCLNSLGVSDLIQQYVMRTQQLPLFVYQPPIAITIHGVIAQVEKANIEWPKSSQRCRMMLMEKKEIFRSWHYKIMPYISRHLSTKSFVEDLVSPLLHILSPPTMRPVAFHLLTEKEKTDLVQVVGAMVSYSVTYKNARANPLLGTMRDEAALDSSTLSFDPPISDFINFKGHMSGHYVLSLAVKQVLVHEVEKQRILQVSMGRSVHLADECTKGNQAMACEKNNRAQFAKLDYAACFEKNMDKAKAEISMKQTKTLTSNTASALDSNKSASTSVKLKSPGDTKKTSGGSSSFFDRFRKLSSKGSKKTNDIQLQKAATFERDSHPVLFKFNEGYTNAVKRPVRIRELLL